MPKAKAAPTVAVKQLDIRELTVTLIGDSPLISHAWSKKAKEEMLAKQMKKAKAARDAKDPFRDFCDSLYWLSEKPDAPTAGDVSSAQFGFPVVAFKSAAVDACSHIEGITKVEARGAFHINGEFAAIEGHPTSREDMVRVGMGTADLRYRGEFKAWRTKLSIRYNAAVLSPEQIVHLFNTGGFAIGVGEWRPQKDGSFGMFHVALEGE